MLRAYIKLIAVIIVSSQLTACVNAAVSGAQAVYNRHNIQKDVDDSYTSVQAYRAIDAYGNLFKDTHITIATFHDSILLAGQVISEKQKTEIEKIVRNVAKDRTIYNFLEIANPSSALTRASDSWITAKIKSRLIAIDEADPTQIKVVTENGVVYLMGIVEPRQAEIATDVAKETDGVQKVVKIFSYIQISKKI
jgi:osmotically-inducible protein OsmY